MRIAILIAGLMLGAAALGAHADDGAGTPDVAALQARADALGLADGRAWLTALHYEKGFSGIPHSAVDSDWFFLAEDGHRDARAELHATLRAFAGNRTIAKREEPAACVFGLRWRILDEALDLTAAGVPQPACERRADWLAALNPERLWLVFPSAYLNSPASMFGHTLLRIDGTRGSEDAPLLAYAVNFAAETGEQNGLVYAVKGLTGGYTGRFSVMPYYEKVREYSRIDSRDLWEYPLRLDDAAIERLMLHLWEMRGAGFDYFFFTKNCSFQLLTLLEAAMPERDLRAGLELWAIPTDTVRALQHQGLIGAPHYRPSLSTTISHRATQIGDTDTRTALAVGEGERAPGTLADDDPVRAARILDVAHDWLYYRVQSGGAERDPALTRARGILGARAATGVKSGFRDAAPPDTPPQNGHDTARFSAGAFAEDDASGVAINLRAAYHDLLDPPEGYDHGSQVAFGDAELRWNGRRDRLQIDELRVVDIVSLSPRSTLFRPISWRVHFGGRRLSGLDSAFGGHVDGGPGLTTRIGTLTPYIFGRLAADAADDLDDGYTIGAGATAGALWQPSPAVSLLIEGSSRSPILGAEFERHELRGGAQWHWGDQIALRAEGYLAHERGRDRSGVRLAFVRYIAPAFAPAPSAR